MNSLSQLILVAICLLNVVLLIVAEQDQVPNNEIQEGPTIVGQSWRKHILAKLFNFDQYVKNFGRHYSGILEWMNRRKIYLGRLLRVFTSLINYGRWKSDSYLGLNQFSDRTPKELASIVMSKEYAEIPQLDKENIQASLLDSKRRGAKAEIERIRKPEHKNDQKSKSRTRRDVDNHRHMRVDVIPEDIHRSEDMALDDITQLGDDPTLKDMIAYLFQNRVAKNVPGIIDWLNSKVQGQPVEDSPPLNRGSDPIQVNDRVSIDEVGIDHRESNCLLPPRDQGECMSCYALATIAFYEWAHCKATGELVAFSEQYIVDCGNLHQHFLNGCRGGAFRRVGDFVDEFGLELGENYPYIGEKYQCPYTNEVPPSQRGYMRLSSSGWIAFPVNEIDLHLEYSPIIIGMKVNHRFLEYGGGVDLGSGCSEEVGLHAGLIVGSGTQDGEEYWLIRNSFSPNWGEQGHHKLNKRSDCLEPAEGYLLRAPFNSVQEDNINLSYNGSSIEERRDLYVAMKEQAKRSEKTTVKKRKFRR